MDFGWAAEQLGFKNEVVVFAKRELNANVLGRDQGVHFPGTNRRRLSSVRNQGARFRGKCEQLTQ